MDGWYPAVVWLITWGDSLKGYPLFLKITLSDVFAIRFTFHLSCVHIDFVFLGADGHGFASASTVLAVVGGKLDLLRISWFTRHYLDLFPVFTLRSLVYFGFLKIDWIWSCSFDKYHMLHLMLSVFQNYPSQNPISGC